MRAELSQFMKPEVRQRCAEVGPAAARVERSQFPSSNMQPPALKADLTDVRAALRELRFTQAEIEVGLASVALLPSGVTPEERLRAALKVLKLRSAREELPMAMATV